jgi:hypothetical protein
MKRADSRAGDGVFGIHNALCWIWAATVGCAVIAVVIAVGLVLLMAA